MIKIVGIDPGLAETGIGVVRGSDLKVDTYSFGVVQTAKTLSLAVRLDLIFSKLLQVFESETPDLLVIEDIFTLKANPQSGITLAKVSGVIQLAGFRARVPTLEVPVREAKQVLTGNGNAGKAQLAQSVRHAIGHPEPLKPFHISDALALALIGLYRYKTYISKI